MKRPDDIFALIGAEKMAVDQQYLLHVLLMSIQSDGANQSKYRGEGQLRGKVCDNDK